MKAVAVSPDDRITYGIDELSIDTEARNGAWELYILSTDGCEKTIIMNLGNMSSSQRVRECMHNIHGYCREHKQQHKEYFDGGHEATET